MVLQFGLSFIKLCIDWILKKDFVLVKIERFREISRFGFIRGLSRNQLEIRCVMIFNLEFREAELARSFYGGLYVTEGLWAFVFLGFALLWSSYTNCIVITLFWSASHSYIGTTYYSLLLYLFHIFLRALRLSIKKILMF